MIHKGLRLARPSRVAIVVLQAALAGIGCSAPEENLDAQASGSVVDEPLASAMRDGWSQAEVQLLRSLTIASLPALEPSPSNRVATDPRAARLGHRLFFEPRLSASGAISCNSCHRPERDFADLQAKSSGMGQTSRNAPTLIGAAYSPWQYWDGRRDSLWAQALAPMEARAEMGSTRLEVVRFVTTDPDYREAYAELFGPAPDFTDASRFPASASPYGDKEARAAWLKLPAEAQQQVNRAFSNVGKAIAAYERLLVPGVSDFDRYVEQLLDGEEDPGVLSPDAIAGLRLFIDPARSQCLRCHNGPLLTNHAFHDIATNRFSRIPDLGRFVGVQSLLLDEFNCLGPYSDAPESACQELKFLNRREIGEKAGAFKTPTLRGVGRTPPYLHDGSFETLEQVIEHYRNPPPSPGSELQPLELRDEEVGQLVAFLESLSGGVAADVSWLGPPEP